jgi:hypothetical protein
MESKPGLTTTLDPSKGVIILLHQRTDSLASQRSVGFPRPVSMSMTMTVSKTDRLVVLILGPDWLGVVHIRRRAVRLWLHVRLRMGVASVGLIAANAFVLDGRKRWRRRIKTWRERVCEGGERVR